jgi:hypothetical protein
MLKTYTSIVLYQGFEVTHSVREDIDIIDDQEPGDLFLQAGEDGRFFATEPSITSTRRTRSAAGNRTLMFMNVLYEDSKIGKPLALS